MRLRRSGTQNNEVIVRTTYVTAIVIAVLIGLWLLSGQLGGSGTQIEPSLAEQSERAQAAREDREPTAVRARVLHAEQRYATVHLRGRTDNKRTVDVRTETVGRVIERPVERGSRVAAGDLLCRLALDDRQARVNEARDTLQQAQVDFDGAQRLAERGLQSESQIAAARARLAATRAQLTRAELDLERASIRAPFAGIVDDVAVEVGDFAQVGSICATVIDLDPMLLVARVPERDVGQVARATHATATLLDGRTVRGQVTFVGSRSDTATRTYPVEIQVDNPDFEIRSGVTAQITVPVDSIMAHRVSPALLTLDDAGRMGIRILNGDNRVEFHNVEILGDDAGDIWIAGLPEIATVITVGQELVVPGERVQVTYEDGDSRRAASDRRTRVQ
jgi:membrane fusion protein, multidrug efflux system